MIKHDEWEKKDIHFLFSLNGQMTSLKEGQAGRLAAPNVGGRYIINNTSREIYITLSDSSVYRIPPMSKDTRRWLLMQLYILLGAKVTFREKHQSEFRIPENFTPVPIYPREFLKEWENNYSDAIDWKLSEDRNTRMDVDILEVFQIEDSKPSESVDPYDRIDRDKYLEILSKIDDVCEITRMLRQNKHTVFTLQIHNENVYRIHSSTSDTKASFMGWSSYLSTDNPGYCKIESAIIQSDKSASMMEIPIHWEEIKPTQLDRCRGGLFMPEYSWTIGYDQFPSNKQLGYLDQREFAYCPRTGFRIIIPGRPRTGETRAYAKIGNVIQRIELRSIEEGGLGDLAIIYGYNGMGEELQVAAIPIDDLFKKPVVGTIDDIKFSVTFHRTKDDAMNFIDEIDEARFKEVLETRVNEAKYGLEKQNVQLSSELKIVQTELSKLRRREEEFDKAKTKKSIFDSIFTSILTNSRVIGVIVGSLITVGIGVISYMKGSAVLKS